MAVSKFYTTVIVYRIDGYRFDDARMHHAYTERVAHSTVCYHIPVDAANQAYLAASTGITLFGKRVEYTSI